MVVVVEEKEKKKKKKDEELKGREVAVGSPLQRRRARGLRWMWGRKCWRRRAMGRAPGGVAKRHR